MALNTSLWSVEGSTLQEQDRIVLNSERRLEDWIAADLSLLGEELLLVGRQVLTASGPLDLLAIDSEGTLVIAELKRDRTPREVVAQVLDYASWVRQQSVHEVDALFRRQHPGQTLTTAFREKFEIDLPEAACQSHRMLVVAAALDDSSERILHYLQDQHAIDINAVFFSVYRVGGQEVLVRAWLADPIETKQPTDPVVRPPWSGVWYVNHTANRDWELRRRHGFITAGQGEKYYRPLFHLPVNDLIAVYQPGAGYLGTGRIRSAAVPADEYKLDDGRPLTAISSSIRGSSNDHGERVVGVDWIKTVPVAEAKTFKGAFFYRNVVCKLRDEPTLDFLKQQFGFEK